MTAYSEQVLDHFYNPRCAFRMPDADTLGALESIKRFDAQLELGERVVLSDGEVEVEAVLFRNDRIWLGRPDESTWRRSAQ